MGILTYKTTFNPKEKTWNGKQVSTPYNPNISAGQALLWMLKRNEDKIGQISEDNGVTVTNGELYLNSVRVAQNLTKLGYADGDIIGIAAKNSHQLAPIIFAALSIGCPLNNLDPSWGELELTHMLGITRPKVVFCDKSNVHVIKSSLDALNLSVPIFTFDGTTNVSSSVEKLFMATNIEEEFVPIHIENGSSKPALIVCSSGTTGLSKGVCLSHAAVLDRMFNLIEFANDDIAFSYSSLYWMTGILTLLGSTLFGITRVITTNVFSPEHFVSLVSKYKVTYVIAPPSHLSLLLKSNAIADLPSIRYYLCGGSIVPDFVINGMKQFLPNGNIYAVYGLTEICGAATMNYPQPKPGSVGCLTNEISAKILNDSNVECDINVDGEICFKIKYPFLEYFGDKENTENACDQDGWFKTGDIGHFDEDGYLYIVDRKKDILKYRNNQISPSEIENVLLKVADIKQACVIGIPDDVSTELPAAIIVRQPNSHITESDIDQIVVGQLSDPKKLRGGIYFVDELPMTPSGKVIKRLVKEKAITLYKALNAHQ